MLIVNKKTKSLKNIFLISILSLGLCSILYFFNSFKVESRNSEEIVKSNEFLIPKKITNPIPSQQVISDKDNAKAAINLTDSLEKEYMKLPSFEDMKSLSEGEVHGTPEIVLQAGGIIGEVELGAQRDKSQRAFAMIFFRNCAQDSALVHSVRALCLNKVYTLIPKWRVPVFFKPDLIPDVVKKLALRLLID